MSLGDVAEKAAAENAMSNGTTASREAARDRRAIPSRQKPATQREAAVTSIRKPKPSLRAPAQVPTTNGAPEQETAEKASFDESAYRTKIANVLTELRLSHDVTEAASRLSQIHPAPTSQSKAVYVLLAEVVQEGRADARSLAFSVLASLLVSSGNKVVISEGLQSFLEHSYEDLRIDVPALPQILHQELCPILVSLVEKDLLTEATLTTFEGIE